jgi:glycosyltransferase involved in cell wall biosynthesis
VANVLYITYDGLTDPLGRSQILPYLQGCAAEGHRITITSCEKPDRFLASGSTVGELCRASGIEWHPRRYHKSPPVLSTIYDARVLTRTAAQLHRKRSFDLVHCRSYIAALAGLKLKRSQGVPLLFDMRGFWPEERVEGGLWRLSSPIFRRVFEQAKRLESTLLRQSDHIISLTEAGKDQLLSRPECLGQPDRISVIPCCVDFDHFTLAASRRDEARSRLGIGKTARVLLYVGSTGGWHLLDEMFDFFREYNRHYPGARFLFITMDDAGAVVQTAAKRGVEPERVLVRQASREEIPELMAAADAGIALKRPSFSALASSPTKLGEMLAMGIPVVANSGVGDVDELIARTGGGVVLNELKLVGYAAAITELERLPASASEIRKRASQVLGLDLGVHRYSEIYTALAGVR